MKKVDCQPGIKPGPLDYMPSVLPLDHQQSCFSMLFNSQLRVLHCPIYDLDNFSTCVLHAKYYGMHMCMHITLLRGDAHVHAHRKWSTTIYITLFSFALMLNIKIFSPKQTYRARKGWSLTRNRNLGPLITCRVSYL